MKVVRFFTGKNRCQRCKLKCKGHIYIAGAGYDFPLILCKKCGRKIRNGLNDSIGRDNRPQRTRGKKRLKVN